MQQTITYALRSPTKHNMHTRSSDTNSERIWTMHVMASCEKGNDWPRKWNRILNRFLRKLIVWQIRRYVDDSWMKSKVKYPITQDKRAEIDAVLWAFLRYSLYLKEVKDNMDWYTTRSNEPGNAWHKTVNLKLHWNTVMLQMVILVYLKETHRKNKAMDEIWQNGGSLEKLMLPRRDNTEMRLKLRQM